jgi:isoleucyl-tRNA synthetase
MTRWIAPILSFTAEEAWALLPGRREESVFFAIWHELPDTPASGIDWDTLLALRGEVTRELERLRDAGRIGAPLEAEIDLWCAPGAFERFAALGDELRFLLITSAARVHRLDPGASAPPDAIATTIDGVALRAIPSQAAKCVRCWHRREDVGSTPAHPELCARCVVNVDGPGESRSFA